MTHDMPTLASTLDALRRLTGSDSDSARVIGCTRQDIYLARKRRTIPDRLIVAAAAALSISAPYLLAAIHADTSTDDTVRAAWLETAAALTPAPPSSPLYYVKSEPEQKCDDHASEKPHSTVMHGSILLAPEKEKAYRLLQWCLCVPRLAPDSPRLAYYASRWDVPGKIARAIEDGSFSDIVKDCPPFDLRHLPAAIAALAECERYAKSHAAHTAPESLSKPAKARLHA